MLRTNGVKILVLEFGTPRTLSPTKPTVYHRRGGYYPPAFSSCTAGAIHARNDSLLLYKIQFTYCQFPIPRPSNISTAVPSDESSNILAS